MSNVVLLFANESDDGVLDPNQRLDEAVIHVMSCSASLEGWLQDLCRHLDAVDQVIDHLGDVSLQRSLRGQALAGRQALVQARQELRDELRNLPSLRRRAADKMVRNRSGR
jgi:hypothetical protein